MLGGADNPNGELLSYIIGADRYAGAETGYRYHLTEDTFIEPQAELVYGAVSGKTFR